MCNSIHSICVDLCHVVPETSSYWSKDKLIDHSRIHWIHTKLIQYRYTLKYHKPKIKPGRKIRKQFLSCSFGCCSDITLHVETNRLCIPNNDNHGQPAKILWQWIYTIIQVTNMPRMKQNLLTKQFPGIYCITKLWAKLYHRHNVPQYAVYTL